MRLTTAIALATLAPAVLSAQTQVQSEASITSTTIEACYVKSSGTVYRINATNTPTKCSTNGTGFSWNSQGPQGPAGPAGPQGPIGPFHLAPSPRPHRGPGGFVVDSLALRTAPLCPRSRVERPLLALPDE